jgi:hypothetical protein
MRADAVPRDARRATLSANGSMDGSAAAVTTTMSSTEPAATRSFMGADSLGDPPGGRPALRRDALDDQAHGALHGRIERATRQRRPRGEAEERCQ